MVEWKTINISKELLDEVKNTVEKSSLWINEPDFIREAIREKLEKVNACKLVEA